MRVRKLILVLSMFLVAVAIAGIASAATFLVPDDASFIASSQAIVVARTTAIQSERNARGDIVTIQRMDVVDVLKGSPAPTIDVVTPGGWVDGTGLVVTGVPHFRVGDSNLVFLVKGEEGEWRVNGWALGKFDFVNRPDGSKILVRGVDDGELFGYDSTTKQPHEEMVRDERFLGYIRQITAGLKPSANYFTNDDYAATVAIAQSEEPIFHPNGVTKTPYLVVGGPSSYGLRRHQFDVGQPGYVNYYVNGSLSGVNGTAAVDAGLAAWTNDPGSVVDLSRAGTTTHTSLDTACSPSPEDPITDDIILGMSSLPGSDSGNTVAYAYLCVVGSAYSLTSPTESFYPITEADIGVKSIVSSLGQKGADEVLTHEIGHTLGFRHSNASSPSSSKAVMYPVISGNYGSQLQDWDYDAVESVFGNGPICRSVQITDPNTPVDQSIAYGTSATLRVTTSGSTPITYEWKKTTGAGEVTVGTTTTPSFGTGPLTETTQYRVFVSNSCQSAFASRLATVTVGSCIAPTVGTQPQSTTIESGQTVRLTVSASGSKTIAYQWYQGASGDTSTPIAGATSSAYTTPPLTTTMSYWVRVSNDCGTVNSDTATITVPGTCEAPGISLNPASQAISSGTSAELTVAALGTEPITYQWYQGTAPDTSNPILDATGTTYMTPALTTATNYWVRATNECGFADSTTAIISIACNTPAAPTISASPAQAWTSQIYTVSWDSLNGVTNYELQESTSSDFTTPLTQTISGTSYNVAKIVSSATRFYYRVRGIADCNGSIGPYSRTVSVAVVLPPPATSPEPEGTVPFGSEEPISFDIFIPGDIGAAGVGASSTTFFATSSEPWMTVTPSSGNLPAEGTTIVATAMPSDLPVGTNTVSIEITTTTTKKGGVTIKGGTPLTVPVSVSLVTPVSPVANSQPQANSLIIPQVAHATGFNSQWQSDVRVFNTLSNPTKYSVFYTPTGLGGTTKTMQTSVNILGGATTALNDILKNWYTQGSTGGSFRGAIEVRPPATLTKSANASLASPTVVTSRTFNKAPDGTYGLFMSAIPYANFVGRDLPDDGGPATLHLQQVANSSLFRTNIGLIEASGQPVSGELLVYDDTGTQVGTVPFSLQANENVQESYLTNNGISVDNGRIEIHVTSDTGRIAAYAAVTDNYSQDPILVPATELSNTKGERWVLAGVADYQTGIANWRSDVRIYNAGDSPVDATLTFYPQLHPENATSVNVSLGGGELSVLDNIIRQTFGKQQTGGSLVITTNSESSLVATARTYDQRPANDPDACPSSPVGCTFGQFLNGVTPDSTNVRGFGDAPLQLVQLEQSDRFRTNVAIAEVSGQPASVRISATIPGSLASPSTTYNLKANEMVQITDFLRDWLGLGSAVYNARVTINVTGGEGKVFSYASVVDNRTQDPTYVPAQ